MANRCRVRKRFPTLGESDDYEEVLNVAARDKIALNVGGTWYYRDAGESESAALHRLRQKAWRTGHDLHMIRLGLPSQVGTGGVTVTPPVVASLGQSPVSGTPPTAPGIGIAGQVLPPTGQPLAQSPGQPPTAAEPPAQSPTPAISVIRKSMGAKTGINLLGDLENWAYPDNQRITQASLTINDLSVKELRDLCTRLPAKIRAELQITLPPEGDQSR